MKIYISHSSGYDYINKIYKPIKESSLMKNNTFFFPHDDNNKVINTKDIIKESDLFLAEVSEASTGQGIEIGFADCFNTKILCIYEAGTKISSALKFVTNNFIEYKDSQDMINKIKEFINNN